MTEPEQRANGEYVVVHPLDDAAEAKVDIENIAFTPMRPVVRWSLIALRIYVTLMTFVVLFRCLQLARFIS